MGARERGLPPWGADWELDEDAVAAVLRDQFPDLAPWHVRYLREGWDNRVYVVNDEWIFRMPKRADVVSSFAVERALLPILAEALPVAVPRIELEGRPDGRFPHPFAGYRILPGDVGDAVPIGDFATSAVARQLGALLRAIHDVPRDIVAGAGVPNERGDSPRKQLDEGLEEDGERLESALGPARWRALRDYLGSHAPPRADRTPCFCHADLDVGHLLLDPGTRRITGMIDWADASIGDPARDFVTFQMRCGEAFVETVLDAYGTPDRAAMHAWIRDAARRQVVVWLGECLRMGGPEVADFIACFDRLYAAPIEAL